ncbi:hypothetical protein DFQ27_003409 [Actinomortierella ambigua]|uniref:Uncharacterized protein n=1 Tax=Actinomortierella ambigua TaxID=1343610 RepID=A0A9P6Q899_9FUNG|nr:hypothetical protein DFQ27_003409 [Actinomortierella ambigua]
MPSMLILSVKAECEQFPEHAEQLFQVYLDLTEAKEFKDGEYHLVLPILASESWTTRSMAYVFESMAQEQDERLLRASQKTYD